MIVAVQKTPFLMLSGICLQGGAFDGRQIQQLKAESPVNNPTPMAYVAWVDAAAPREQHSVMHVPLYSDLRRLSILPVWLEMPVTSKHAKQQHLLAGLAACITT